MGTDALALHDLVFHPDEMRNLALEPEWAPLAAELDESWTSRCPRRSPRPYCRPSWARGAGGFLLDPDGNSAEAVHQSRVRQPGVIDHLWIRVADVTTAKRFYAALVPRAGFRLGDDTPGPRPVHRRGRLVLAGLRSPTEHLHVGFPADEDAAAVRDPDGNRIELIQAPPGLTTPFGLRSRSPNGGR